MIRVAIGLICALGGIVLAGLSASALSVVGTGEITSTEPFEPGENAYAVVLDEAVVPFEHTEATFSVTSDQELFLGTANGVDIEDYLTGIAHEEVTDVDFPHTAVHRTVSGEPQPVSLAPDRDWWTHTGTGTTVSHSFDLDASPQMILVAPAGEDGTLEGAEVTVSMDVHEVLGFAIAGFAGAVALLGVAAFYLMRWWFGRFRPRPKSGAGVRGNRSDAVSDGRRGGRTERASRGKGAGRGKGASRGKRAGRGARLKDGLRPRSAMVVGGGLAVGLVLSGCAYEMPQPARPELTPYERPAVREGDAGSFLTSYSEDLDAALKDDPGSLDGLQTGPLLERTRAEMLIAEQTDSTLGAESFTDVIAAGPMFSEYPMWFMAFAAPEDNESEEIQAMLVTRESASADWLVANALFVPEEAQPTILADRSGAVEPASAEHTEAAAQVVSGAVEYLSTGEAQEGLPDYEAAGFKDFRNYVGELGADDTGFSDVEVDCHAYDEVPLGDYALATEDGGVSFGEARCTIQIDVPGDYFVDLGDEIEAVMTTDADGSVITIEVAQPLLVTTEGKTANVYSPGWFMLSSATADG